jgi:probable F420-dependent oxidoreductase
MLSMLRLHRRAAGEDIPSRTAEPLTGMEYGIALPGAGPLATPEAVTAVATLAESAGFTSVWVTDHIAIPQQSASAYPYRADGRPPWPPDIKYLDALTALTWVAAVTHRVRLGTSVLILPLRPPLAVAKAVGTLDYLSGGRVLLGVGAGWLREEFDLLGAPFDDRGPRTREAVRILRACWGPDPVAFEGVHYRLRAFGMDPKPAQGARIPILGGGESDAALRRVADVCDGWHPLNLSPAQLEERLARLRTLVERAGRRFSDLTIAVRPGQQATLTPDLGARYAALGVHMIVADVNYRELSLPAALTQVRRLSETFGLS